MIDGNVRNAASQIKKYLDGVFLSINEPGTKWHQLVFVRPSAVNLCGIYIALDFHGCHFSFACQPTDEEGDPIESDEYLGMFMREFELQCVYYQMGHWSMCGRILRYHPDGSSVGHEDSVGVYTLDEL